MHSGYGRRQARIRGLSCCVWGKEQGGSYLTARRRWQGASRAAHVAMLATWPPLRHKSCARLQAPARQCHADHAAQAAAACDVRWRTGTTTPVLTAEPGTPGRPPRPLQTPSCPCRGMPEAHGTRPAPNTTHSPAHGMHQHATHARRCPRVQLLQRSRHSGVGTKPLKPTTPALQRPLCMAAAPPCAPATNAASVVGRRAVGRH